MYATKLVMNTNIEKIQKQLSFSGRRDAINQKFSCHKIGHRNWSYVAAAPEKEQHDIRHFLYNAGQGLLTESQLKKASRNCGETHYLKLRSELVKKKIILNEKPVKKIEQNTKSSANPKKLTADEIRQQNNAKNVNEKFEALMKKIPEAPVLAQESSTIDLSTDYGEITIIRMMIQAKLLCDRFIDISVGLKKTDPQFDRKKYKILSTQYNDLENELIEMRIGYSKILNEKRLKIQSQEDAKKKKKSIEVNKEMPISETALDDMTVWIEYISKLTNYSFERIIAKNNTNILFRTAYDNMLESYTITMHEYQRKLFDFVTTNHSHLALVHAVLGSGKTTMAICLSGWLRNQTGRDRIKGLFCCTNMAVNLEVGNMLYSLGIPFAFVTIDMRTKGNFHYSWSSHCSEYTKKRSENNLDKQNIDKKNKEIENDDGKNSNDKLDEHNNSAIFYICDIFVARELIEQRQKFLAKDSLYLKFHKQDPTNYPLSEDKFSHVPEYLLMIDEPTKNADQQNSFQSDAKFSLETEVFVDIVKKGGPRQILFSSTLPTYEQLKPFYDAITEKNPGMKIQSFFTTETKIACSLSSSQGELYAPHNGSTSVNELKEIIENITKNPLIARFYTFEILQDMINKMKKYDLSYPNMEKIFDQSHKLTYSLIQKETINILNTLVITGSDELVEKICKLEVNPTKKLDIDNIFKKGISQFSRGCIVFSSDPISTAIEWYHRNFDGFFELESGKTDIFEQIKISDILHKYENTMNKFMEERRRVIDKKSDIKTRSGDDAWKHLSQMERPKWEFPEVLQISSSVHRAEFDCTTPAMRGGVVVPEDMPQNSIISNELMTMLASGIGVVMKDTPRLDEEYINTVILLAKNKKLKFIFSDISFAFGTHLDVSSVIIVDEPVKSLTGELIPAITDMYSASVALQMTGRAGRGGGFASSAQVFTTSESNNLISIFHKFVRNVLDEGTKNEAENIYNCYQTIWNM